MRLPLLILFVVGTWLAAREAEPAAGSPARNAWTTSKVVGSPEPPPPYKYVNAFPKLSFKNPVLLRHEAGSDRFFVAEQAGKMFSFPNSPDAAKADLFVDLKAELKSLTKTPGATGVEAIYGFCFHPKFADNRTCFVCYTVNKNGANTLAEGTRISRFTVTKDSPPRLDVASEEIVLTFMQGGHNGGDIHFGHDGFLYISSGDGSNPNPPDRLKTGQDCSDLLSSILRIDVDRKDDGKNYAVPKDNPFVDVKGVRPEIWAFGFRNPWRMSIDRKTGELWVGDVGWELWEMVHRVQKGGNYGWSVVEGRQPVNVNEKVGPSPILPPLIELPHTAAASVTGGYVYRGKKFPDLVGAYLFGDWETRRLWAAKVEGSRVVSMPEITEPTVRIVAFGEDAAGEVYILDYDAGTVHTLAKNDATSTKPEDFPRKLSQTGLYASVKDHTLAVGVVPFQVNAARWDDGATSERFAAFPNGGKMTWLPYPMGIPGSMFTRQFDFPENAVLGRTVSLGGKRLETQLLHFDGKNWRGYTYAWNAAQTDAELVPADGGETEVSDGKLTKPWNFPSRTQCLVCHNPWAQHALAFNPEQLNRVAETPLGKRNQLLAFEELGLLQRTDDKRKPLPPLKEPNLAKLPTLTDPHDFGAKLDSRARSYLHVNCGHCHRFGGGGSVDIELHLTADLKKSLGVAPARGTFDLPDAKILTPGDPHRSVLFYRMAKFNRGRMPHLGSEHPDPRGVTLIRDWVRSLPGGSPLPLPDFAKLTDAELTKALGSPASGFDLAVVVADEKTPAEVRRRILTASGKLPPGNVRDLFEGYLPNDGKERKIGPNPRPGGILSAEGNSERGRDVYFSKAVQCQTCHKLDGQGSDLGPDLSQIGQSRSRQELLESLLEPSRQVDPKFQAFLVKTIDGRAFTGLLLKRDAKELVLKDSQAKEVRLAADDVESVQPTRESLMPSGPIADLTRQEAADLLAFLVSRK